MSRTEWIYGLHAVQAALRYQAHQVQEVWLDASRKDTRMDEVEQLAVDANIPVQRVKRARLDELFPEKRHQGVAARSRVADSTASEQDLDSILENHAQVFLLILDGVQDPHNLGACLRSAEAAGVHAVIVPRDRAVGLTATVRKVACGAAEVLPFIQVTNLARTLKDLKGKGVWLVGLSGEGDRDLYDCDLTGSLALVLGAEEKGVRRLTREHCDFLARIPMAGTVESLNVSVATGVSLFEAVRQRRKPAT